MKNPSSCATGRADMGVLGAIFAGFAAAHNCTGYSQRANCGSLAGFSGGPLLGPPFFVQKMISCTPREGSVFQSPRKTGGSESSSASGAAGANGSDEYFWRA